MLLLGLALTLAGCLALYLGASQQSLLAHPWPASPARIAGVVLLAAGLAALLRVFQPVATVFVFVTWVMLMFVLLPYLGALRRLHEVNE